MCCNCHASHITQLRIDARKLEFESTDPLSGEKKSHTVEVAQILKEVKLSKMKPATLMDAEKLKYAFVDWFASEEKRRL